MKVIIDTAFDNISNDKSQVFQIFPNVFSDNRGYFSEVLKDPGKWPCENLPLWITTFGWIRQINRSSSKGQTVRGCHAQKGVFCQGKLVEALTEKIYDIITDARPDSKTFGVSKIYVLDPENQNKLWVPRGFLHAFAVPETNSNAIFQYYCDNVFDKQSEIGINPLSLLPNIINLYKENNIDNSFSDLYELFEKQLILSEKDTNGLDYQKWMSEISKQYQDTGKLWYK